MILTYTLSDWGWLSICQAFEYISWFQTHEKNLLDYVLCSLKINILQLFLLLFLFSSNFFNKSLPIYKLTFLCHFILDFLCKLYIIAYYILVYNKHKCFEIQPQYFPFNKTIYHIYYYNSCFHFLFTYLYVNSNFYVMYFLFYFSICGGHLH